MNIENSLNEEDSEFPPVLFSTLLFIITHISVLIVHSLYRVYQKWAQFGTYLKVFLWYLWGICSKIVIGIKPTNSSLLYKIVQHLNTTQAHPPIHSNTFVDDASYLIAHKCYVDDYITVLLREFKKRKFCLCLFRTWTIFFFQKSWSMLR